MLFVSVGALKKTHKRVDYLIREFSLWRKQQTRKAHLIIMGAREAETDEVIRLAADLDSQGITIIENASRDQVLSMLQAADVFTLGSLHEMMPIAVLEALGCGLPIACNDDPTLLWMVGNAGKLQAISSPGGLAAQFSALAEGHRLEELAIAARERATTLFSEEVVVNQIVDMYRRVAERP